MAKAISGKSSRIRKYGEIQKPTIKGKMQKKRRDRNTSRKSLSQLQKEIKKYFQFVPSYFSSVEDDSPLGQSLWLSMKTALLDNPIPPLFKFKVGFIVGRYHSQFYWTALNASELRRLGVSGQTIHQLFQSSFSSWEVLEDADFFVTKNKKLLSWPDEGSAEETLIFGFAVRYLLHFQEGSSLIRLKDLLPKHFYDWLILLISFQQNALTWCHLHPELNQRMELKVRRNLEKLVKEEPNLSKFFEFENESYLQSPQVVLSERAFEMSRELSEFELKQRLESELREKTAILEMSDDGIYGLNLKGICTFVNQKAAQLLGYHSSEVLGKNMHTLMHHSYADRRPYPESACPLVQVANTGQTVRHLEEPAWRKDGSMLMVEYASAPIYVQGNLVGAVVNFREISKRVEERARLQAREEMYRKSEEKLLNAIQIARIGFFDWDLSRNKIELSDQFVEHWGIKPNNNSIEELIHRIHLEDRDRVTKLIRSSIKNRTPYRAEYRVVHDDGEVMWIYAQGEAAYDTSGNPDRFFGTCIEITDRKNIEIEADRARKELHDFFLQSPIPMVVLMGPTHIFRFANPQYERMIGRRVQGKTLRDVFTPAEICYFGPLLDEVYATGIPYIGNEFSVRLPDKSGVEQDAFLNVGYYPFLDPVGGTRGIICFIQDVSDFVKARKQVEFAVQELAGEKLKLDAIFAHAPAGISLMSGPELRFEMVNPKWEELVSSREYIGKTYREAFPEVLGNVQEKAIWEVFKTGKLYRAQEMQIVVEVNPGILEPRFFDFSYVRILDGVGSPYGVFCHALDVTERVRSRQSLEKNSQSLSQAIEDLEDERELRDRFVNTLTHDLRTPLTAAKISAQLIERKSSNSESLLKTSGRIIHCVDRVDRMIQDLLDTSRIRAGEGIPIRRERCQLEGIVDSVIAEVTSIHGPRFLKVVKSGPFEGYWDENGIRRMIENLVSNAVKYGFEESPIQIFLSRRPHSVEISVHNEGNPIAKKDQEVLFDQYRRTSSALSGNQKGWGIGLSLVKGIVEAHEGSIEVRSVSGEGTTFVINLPLDPRSSPEKESDDG